MKDPVTWSQMKARVKDQKDVDPQRGTLNERAWNAVEAGLGQLAAAGYGFEIAPKGTLAELVELKEPQGSLSLSIEDGKRLVAKPPNVQTAIFEAVAGPGALNL